MTLSGVFLEALVPRRFMTSVLLCSFCPFVFFLSLMSYQILERQAIYTSRDLDLIKQVGSRGCRDCTFPGLELWKSYNLVVLVVNICGRNRFRLNLILRMRRSINSVKTLP